jgi:hypothetical protein
VIEEGQTESGAERADHRVERLARELASTINAGSVEHRERLREMAVRLLRDEVILGEAELEAGRPSGSPFNPFGIAIPLSLMGGVMLILFPPVGLMLFATATVMMFWGLAVVLFTRR